MSDMRVKFRGFKGPAVVFEDETTITDENVDAAVVYYAQKHCSVMGSGAIDMMEGPLRLRETVEPSMSAETALKGMEEGRFIR